MGQLCPDYINRTATPALFAPLMTQTSYATSEVLYLLTYLLTYLLARDSIQGLWIVKAPFLINHSTKRRVWKFELACVSYLRYIREVSVRARAGAPNLVAGWLKARGLGAVEEPRR